jgi:hypothetical protein
MKKMVDKKRKTSWGILAIAIGAMLVACAGMVWIGVGGSPDTDIPHVLSYQGVLTDPAGNPVPDSSYQITFSIYDSSTGGTLLWSETQTVQVTGGRFNVLLGSVNPLSLEVFSSGSTRWLGVTVGADMEMTPRQQLSSVAYAYVAEYAQNTLAPGQGLEIKDAGGNVTHQLNPNGTSWHAGMETFNGGITITSQQQPPQGLTEAQEPLPAGWRVKETTGLLGVVREYVRPDGTVARRESIVTGVGYQDYYVYIYNEAGKLIGTYKKDLNTGDTKVYDENFTLIHEEKNNGDSMQKGTQTFSDTTDETTVINSQGLHCTNTAGCTTYSLNSDGNSMQKGTQTFSDTTDETTEISHYGIHGTGTDGNTKFLLNNDPATGQPVLIVFGDLVVIGTKEAVVPTEHFGNRSTYCEEATEVYFFDRGEAQLANGVVTITLDPIFLETVTVDDAHPMLVQVTLLSDCKGVYVAQRTATSFTVKELGGGSSNARFMWEIAAKRQGFEDTRLDEVD